MVQKNDSYDVIEAFFKWLEFKIKDNNGKYCGLTDNDLMIIQMDASHSALLSWLCDGNELLPHPPPKAFSRPWHELVVNGKGKVLEAWTHPRFENKIVIEQHADWTILSKESETEFILQHDRTPGVWRLRETDEKILSDDPNSKCWWFLERIETS